MAERKKIYDELEKKIQHKIELIDEPGLKAKLQLLRQNKSFQFLSRRSKSVRHQFRTLSPTKQSIQSPLIQDEQEITPIEVNKQMYMTMQFQYNKGGMPVKRYPAQMSPRGPSRIVLREREKQTFVQLKKISAPKFTPERANILNKNNLFLVPFLKSKIKLFSSEFNGPSVGDVPVNYVYPPYQRPPPLEKKERPLPKISFSRGSKEKRKNSLDAFRGDLGPW